jgi:hypothetical protein
MMLGRLSPFVNDWCKGRVRPKQTSCLLAPFPSVTGVLGARTVTNTSGCLAGQASPSWSSRPSPNLWVAWESRATLWKLAATFSKSSCPMRNASYFDLGKETTLVKLSTVARVRGGLWCLWRRDLRVLSTMKWEVKRLGVCPGRWSQQRVFLWARWRLAGAV